MATNKMLDDILKSTIPQPTPTFSSPDDKDEFDQDPEETPGSPVLKQYLALKDQQLDPNERFISPSDTFTNTDNAKPVSGMGDSLQSRAELPKVEDDSDINKEVNDALASKGDDTEAKKPADLSL